MEKENAVSLSSLSHSHRRLGKGAERFYYIFFVMLHELLKVGTKANDEDVDKIDR